MQHLGDIGEGQQKRHSRNSGLDSSSTITCLPISGQAISRQGEGQ